MSRIILSDGVRTEIHMDLTREVVLGLLHYLIDTSGLIT